MPVEPPPTPWAFPDLRGLRTPDRPPTRPGSGALGDATHDEADDLVALGADLAPGTLLAAYRAGLFPMPIRGSRDMAWWSPDPRGVLPLDALVVSRSLRRSQRRYEVRIDTAFTEVVRACADPRREGAWIDPDIERAYRSLHELGWAHSIETWLDGRLVGGLYGVHLRGLFAGESMFHLAPDASKVALVALVERLRAIGVVLLDVQWLTPHLASLGSVEIPRLHYLDRLDAAFRVDPAPFDRPRASGGQTSAGVTPGSSSTGSGRPNR